MATEDLACRDFVELMTDYFEGALAPVDRARFEAHLSTCPPCTEYLSQMRQTFELAGRLSEDAIPPTGRDELLRLFQDWKGEKGPA